MFSALPKPFDTEWFQILAILIGLVQITPKPSIELKTVSACVERNPKDRYLVGGISAFSTGILFSWPSPAVLELVNDKVNYDITFDESSYFMVISPFGVMLSSLIFANVIDIIGRKWTLVFIVVPQITCWILTATAKSIYVFYVARFLAGVGEACLYSALPTYIGEVATPKVRGTWGNSITFFYVSGEFAINGIGSYFNIAQTAYICVTIPIIFACAFIFMPETPYYLIMKGKYGKAKESLQKLRRTDDVDIELVEIKAAVERQMSERGTWRDVFMITSNRKALIACAFLRAAQQFGGSGTFTLYTQYIFLKAGGNISATASSMIFMGTLAFLTLVAGFTIDLLGRKKSFFYSSLICGIVLIGEFIYFYIDQYHPEIDLSVIKWIPLVLMMSYVVFFSFGLATVPALMLSELFSSSIKGKGLCLMNFVWGFSSSTIPKIFHLMDKNIGIYAPFMFFSVCCFVTAAMSFYIIPETKGRTLEQIQQSLKGNKSCSKKEDIVA